MLIAYLREAAKEAAREAGKPVSVCARTLAGAEREAFVAVLSTDALADEAPANVWLLLRSTFQVIRAAYNS